MPRDLGERDRRAGRPVACASPRRPTMSRPVGRRLQQLGAPCRAPWRAPSVPASRVASPVITVTREANAPMPWSMRSVRPWTTRTRAVVDAERIGADLRDHRLDALSDRGRAGHDLDGAGGVDRRSARRRTGPSPLFSTNMARPAPTSSPPARRRCSSACSASQPMPRERLVEQARIVAGVEHDLGAERVDRPRIRHLGRCRSGCAGAPRRGRCPTFAAIASSSRSRTNVLS